MIEAYSAGIETHGLNPRAVRVMAEAGVDISGHRSKHVDELADVAFDFVVTVCDHAHETCPVFPGRAQVVHVGFDDPPALARGRRRPRRRRWRHYRRVRDEIRAFVETLPDALGTNREGPTMATEACITKEPKGLGFFERYLTLWVLLCIGGGIVLGKVAPGGGAQPGRHGHLRWTARRWSRSPSPSACSS